MQHIQATKQTLTPTLSLRGNLEHLSKQFGSFSSTARDIKTIDPEEKRLLKEISNSSLCLSKELTCLARANQPSVIHNISTFLTKHSALDCSDSKESFNNNTSKAVSLLNDLSSIDKQLNTNEDSEPCPPSLQRIVDSANVLKKHLISYQGLYTASASATTGAQPAGTSKVLDQAQERRLLEGENRRLENRRTCKAKGCKNKINTLTLPCGHLNFCKEHVLATYCPIDGTKTAGHVNIYY